MHTLDRSGLAIVLLTIAMCAQVGSCARHRGQPETQAGANLPPPQSSHERTQLERWADEIETTAGRQPSVVGYPSLTTERASTGQGDSGITVLAMSWSSGLGGGLILLGARDSLLQAYPYRGAHALLSAGARRIAFRYMTTVGSNEYEERLVVLCSLAYGVMFECLNAVVDRRDVVQGIATVKQAAEVSLLGDTVVLRRNFSILRGESRHASVVQLGFTRWVLPRLSETQAGP